MDKRPNPDQLLKRIQAEESHRGQLKLFFGANAGVGKTYAMLGAAQQRRKDSVDVVIGIVETHGRTETAALLNGLEILPRRQVEYKGVVLEEFDLDAALARHPTLILVDELAHTNAPGARHAKRWQDVQELLDAGINVYTTLNVQHWESLNDVVAQITGIVVRETVPDTFLEQSHDIELIDISPEDLLRRLKEGKIYLGPQAERALEHFFQPGNLIALRELALRHTAEQVDLQVQAFKTDRAIHEVWQVADRLLVGVTSNPMSARLVRATQRFATRLRCEWIAAHVETPESVEMSAERRSRLLETMRLAEELGAETVTLSGADVAEVLIDLARSRNVTKIIVGKPQRPQWHERIFGSIVNKIAHRCGDIDLYVISGVGGEFVPRRVVKERSRDSWVSEVWSVLTVAVCTLIAWLLFRHLAQANLIMVYLLGVMWVAYRWGRSPAVTAACLSVISFDFFFVPPYFSFAVSDSQYILTFVVMLLAGLLISTLTGRLRLQNLAAVEREANTRALYRLSRELSETPEPHALVVKAWERLEEFYQVPVLILVPDDSGVLASVAGDMKKFGFDYKEAAVAKWAFDHGQEAGAGTSTLTGSLGLYLPLKGLQGTVGVLGLRPGDTIATEDPDQMQLLNTFASEVGAAFASTQLSEEAGQAKAQVETERLRNLILRSFSIDIHNPLAEISRITRKLLGASPAVAGPLRQGLEEISEKTSHLNNMADELPKLMENRGQRPVSPRIPEAPAGERKFRVSDFLNAETVLIVKGRKTAEEVLKDLILRLHIPDPEEALRLVVEREKAGSTLIGSGLTIPHARIPGLTGIKAALGVVPEGIVSRSGKEEAIHIVMLFLGPTEQFRDHLTFLAAVSELFSNEGLTHDLMRATNPEDALEIIRSIERR